MNRPRLLFILIGFAIILLGILIYLKINLPKTPADAKLVYQSFAGQRIANYHLLQRYPFATGISYLSFPEAGNTIPLLERSDIDNRLLNKVSTFYSNHALIFQSTAEGKRFP